MLEPPLPAAVLFSTAWLNLCRNASSLLISSSMRFANRYRSTHFPRFTIAQLSVLSNHKSGEHTSLVFSKFDRLLQNQLIRVHLSIKAVEWLKHDGEVSGARIYGTPWSHRFYRVDFGFYIL